MPTYIAYFRTDAAHANHAFEARSPQEALKKARAFYYERSEELIFFERYDGHTLNEIVAHDDLRQVALWQDNELRLRLDMLKALELCARCLADLARPDDGTPSISALTQAHAAIARAKPVTVAIADVGIARPLPPDPERPLPPDPENMNGNRAEWAAVALRQFRRKTGCDYEDSLGDLLGDLMHWRHRANVDFEAELDRARGYHEEETAAVEEETAGGQP